MCVYSMTIRPHLNNLTAENVNKSVIKNQRPQSAFRGAPDAGSDVDQGRTDSNVPKHAVANG